MLNINKFVLSFLAVTLCFAAQAIPVDLSIANLPDGGLRLTPVAEGLYSNAVPDVLKTAWDNTFVLIGFKAQQGVAVWGTGFPIFKKTVGKKNYVMLLTAGHVGHDIGSLRPRSGDQFVIASDISFSPERGSAPVFKGELTRAIPQMRTSNALDASAVLLTVSDAQFAQIKTFQFAQGCQDPTGLKNYVIGFPAVIRRPIENQKVKIVDPDTVKKRWSVGLLTQDRESDTFQQQAGGTSIPLIGATTDGLGGNSGSPALDQNGDLIGMLDSGKDDSQYSGDESSTPMKTYNYFAPCTELQKFANLAWASLAH